MELNDHLDKQVVVLKGKNSLSTACVWWENRWATEPAWTFGEKSLFPLPELYYFCRLLRYRTVLCYWTTLL